MSNMLKLLIFLILCWSVGADNKQGVRDEAFEEICSMPEEYSLQLIDCIIDESPSIYQQRSNNIYKCVDKIFENKGKLHSILLYICDGYVNSDSDVHLCVIEKEQGLEKEKKEDGIKFDRKVEYCLNYWKSIANIFK